MARSFYKLLIDYGIPSGRGLSGAGERIRTPDPLITNQLLYRLSYASEYMGAILGILARRIKYRYTTHGSRDCPSWHFGQTP